MSINTRFFISLQAIIIILIIALLGITVSLAFINSQSSANDQKRISDVLKIQEALKVDFNVNGYYPTTTNSKPDGIDTYLDFWPTAPKAGKACSSSQNTYNYSPQSNGEDYSLKFCLGQKYENLSAGTHTATSKGIQ